MDWGQIQHSGNIICRWGTIGGRYLSQLPQWFCNALIIFCGVQVRSPFPSSPHPLWCFTPGVGSSQMSGLVAWRSLHQRAAILCKQMPTPKEMAQKLGKKLAGKGRVGCGIKAGVGVGGEGGGWVTSSQYGHIPHPPHPNSRPQPPVLITPTAD